MLLWQPEQINTEGNVTKGKWGGGQAKTHTNPKKGLGQGVLMLSTIW